MKWRLIRRNWEYFGDVVQNQWPRLTDSDIKAIGGRRDRLERRLRRRYSFGEQEAKRHVHRLLKVVRFPAEVRTCRVPPPAPGRAWQSGR